MVYKTVFNCAELVNIVYEQLPTPTDKIHFMLTCKAIYNTVKNKILLPQESLLNKATIINKSILIEFTKITLHSEYLEISPGPREHLDNQLIDIINKKIKNNTKNIKKLYINPIYENWNIVIQKFNSFENIEYLKIAWTSPPRSLHFFENLNSLKPINIFCDCQETISYRKEIECNKNWSFPKSMKNLTVKCKSKSWIKILLNGLKNFQYEELETIEIIHQSNFIYNFLNHWNEFIRLVNYFKKINIISDFAIFTGEFYNFLDCLVSTNVNIKCHLNLKVSIDSSFWYEIGWNVCEKIELLCIINAIERINLKKLNENDIKEIYNTLYKLQKLETLMFRFTIIDLGIQIETFICNITKNLKNIQITDCTKMNLKNLHEIAKNLKNLEIISLYGIESNDITLDKILELFSNVKVLEVFFKKSFKKSEILEFLKGKKLDNGHQEFIWPKITCLNIFTFYPKKTELNELYKIEKKIPRKCGQLLFDIDKLYFETVAETNIFRITLQKCSGCYKYLKTFRNNIFKITSKIGFYEDKLFEI
uniref:F-box domain-containing protein n=1 Tax=Strongyloides stercoralis TaxID=6248 RepID=A0A0K0EGX2_STRER